MGVDYYTNILVGWRMKSKQFIKRFGKTIPEESHMEHRFDQKTGEQLKDAKVIDEAKRVVLEYDHIQYETCDINEFLEEMLQHPKLKDKLVYACIYEDEDMPKEIILGINLPAVGKTDYNGDFAIGPDLEIPTDLFERIQIVKNLLNEAFNCDIGPARIINAAWISF